MEINPASGRSPARGERRLASDLTANIAIAASMNGVGLPER
jgi:hypothetical protein